jgi:hypothetical protein
MNINYRTIGKMLVYESPHNISFRMPLHQGRVKLVLVVRFRLFVVCTDRAASIVKLGRKPGTLFRNCT